MGLVLSRDKSFSCTTYDEKGNNEANDKGDSGEDDNPKEAAIVTWLMRIGRSVLDVVHTTYIDAGSATGESQSAGNKYYSSRPGRDISSRIASFGGLLWCKISPICSVMGISTP